MAVTIAPWSEDVSAQSESRHMHACNLFFLLLLHDTGDYPSLFLSFPTNQPLTHRSAGSGTYNGGKLEFKIKSAAVMPGVITAVYLSSGDGRTGDSTLGTQDEIDLEFKGNEPTRVQSNVFFNGQENLSVRGFF